MDNAMRIIDDAQISSDGKIVIPLDARNILNAGIGDKIVFIKDGPDMKIEREKNKRLEELKSFSYDKEKVLSQAGCKIDIDAASIERLRQESMV